MNYHWKRTLLTFAIFATPILSTSCDDGPSQVDRNAAVNTSDNGPYVDSTPSQKLGSATGGTNASQICGPEKRRKVWESVLQQPVVPFRGAGGLDASANLAFTGVTIDQLESGKPAYTQTAPAAGLPPPALGWCQGDDGGAGLTFYGEQGELIIRWSSTTRLITSVQANSGYRGTLSFKHPKANEQYTVSLQSKPIDVNGQALHWNWRNPALRAANATKIYNAMMLAFAPDRLPKDTNGAPKESANCVADGGCIATILSNVTGAIAISPLGFIQIYFDLGVDDPIGKDIPTRITMPVQKDFAYASLPVTVKMPGTVDGLGPVSTGVVGNKTCVVKPGISYAAFVSNCIRVTGAAGTDDGEEKKFLAGVTHGPEQYRVDVVGIDPFFLSKRVQDSVEPITITDKDLPEPNDVMNRLTFDQQVKGRILNDYTGESPTGTRDNHSSGLVNLTYAILVQQAIDAADTTPRTKHLIGDPSCQLNPDGSSAIPAAAGCTGMEGFVTTAAPVSLAGLTSYPAGPLANVALGVTKNGQSVLAITTSTGLKPANSQLASFLDDPTSYPDSLNDDVQVVTWAGSARRVIKVLGKGNRLNVPPAFREPRAYAALWMQALTQYMIARGNVGPNVTMQDVLDAGPTGAAAHHIDPNYFFFDTEAASRQQFDTAEYVQRDFATIAQPWVDFRIVVDATGGILNQFTFDIAPLKGERALLTAVGDPAKPIGSDGTMLLTNMFGNNTLSSGWHEPVSTAGAYKTAYDCAAADLSPATGPNDGAHAAELNAFATLCGGDNFPPVDAKGEFARNVANRPLLEPYPGAFPKTSSILNIGRNVGSLGTDVFTVMTRDAYIEQAKVQFARFVTPFNPASGPGAPAVQAVGYSTPNNNTGFIIPINASRDRLVRTEDFFTTGVALSNTIQTIPALDAPGKVRFASVDTNDFLGEAFVCKVDGELLTVRMFTPSELVLNYLVRHPSAYTACNIIVDYWDFGTVLARVTSITNGVIVNFTRPAGVTANANNSAVGDVDLFATGQ